MITDPRSSIESKGAQFPGRDGLIKSEGAAYRQSPPIPRKFVALYRRNAEIRMRSDEHDKRLEHGQGRKFISI